MKPSAASIEVPEPQQIQVVDTGFSVGAQRCRVCGCPFPLGRGSCDYRCPVCRASRRYWSAAQLGTRAQIYVTARDSEFHGESGVGERVSTPEDGWKIKLLSGGSVLFFGAGSVCVDFELPPIPEPPKAMLCRHR